MAAKQVRVERLVWDACRGRFAPTGEVEEGDPPRLDQLVIKVSRPRALFLKGPVPWPWIVAAAALPGQALVVGLCIWRLAGARRSSTISLGSHDLIPFGVGRAAKSRALSALQKAGLVSVTSEPGRFPIVTLPAVVGSQNRSISKTKRDRLS